MEVTHNCKKKKKRFHSESSPDCHRKQVIRYFVYLFICLFFGVEWNDSFNNYESLINNQPSWAYLFCSSQCILGMPSSQGYMQFSWSISGSKHTVYLNKLDSFSLLKTDRRMLTYN